MENMSTEVSPSLHPIEFESLEFKREISRTLTCINQKNYDYTSTVLLHGIDGKVTVVGTTGEIMYVGKMEGFVDGKLNDPGEFRIVLKGSDLIPIVKGIDPKGRKLAVRFDPVTLQFSYGNSSWELKKCPVPFPNYSDILHMQDKLKSKITSGLYFSMELLSIISKVVKGPVKITMHGPDGEHGNPTFIECGEGGIFIIMPMN